jgi:hypothetical protein
VQGIYHPVGINSALEMEMSHEHAKQLESQITALWGLFTRKKRWSLSWRGWVLLTSAGLLTAYLAFLNVYPFLAVTHRVNTDVLVVEGWIPRYAIRKAAEEFKTDSYQRIFTTGGPVEGSDGYTNDYNTSASVGAENLKNLGIPGGVVQMVPSRALSRERTYGSAVALRDWFREHSAPVQSINVLTEGAHARRTRLLYQKAFGRNVTIGIIAVSNPEFNPRQWWHYSDGLREVIGESIAYIYARFFFWPQAATPRELGDGR